MIVFTTVKQCCGSGMFYPGCFTLDPGSDHFLIPDPPDPDPNIFHPGSHMKSGMQTYFFLASYASRSKVLDIVIVKKIRDPEKFTPDPDPGSRG
jgi:hypothetical protein